MDNDVYHCIYFGFYDGHWKLGRKQNLHCWIYQSDIYSTVSLQNTFGALMAGAIGLFLTKLFTKNGSSFQQDSTKKIAHGCY
jgi:hypothetical protein